MKNRLNLTKTFLGICIFFLGSCWSLTTRDPLSKESERILRICFWNVQNLTEAHLKKQGKGNYIFEFSKSCDMIVFSEIRFTNWDIVQAFQNVLGKGEKQFICEEGISKGLEEGTRTEKYLACVNKEISEEIPKEEYVDEDNDFARPPTLFFVNIAGKKILLVPFQSTPGDKEELRNFQKVVDLAYRKYSDRRIFFGGVFHTGSNYQKGEFLASLPYFVYLKQLIREPTTFANQSHDLVFTDKISVVDCKGKVWKLDTLIPSMGGRKELEKISNHFPVSAECKFK
jgi:hypothetical protein